MIHIDVLQSRVWHSIKSHVHNETLIFLGQKSYVLYARNAIVKELY